MSFAHVCNSKMYRSAVLPTVILIWVVGCNKPTKEMPPVEPATKEAKEVEPEKQEVAKAEEAEAQKEEAAEPEAPKPLVIKDVGFKTPESILYEEKSDIYLVSNINGSLTEADNNGFISKVKPDGTVENLTWISGGQNGVTLNAPKGMGVKDDILYVTDIDTVRMFELATGASKGEVKIKKATFLNDISVGPTGTIYVSDSGLKSDDKGLSPTGTDSIWTISGKKAKKLIAGAELNRPNGLLADEGGVLVVTNGGTELYRVTDKGKKEAPVTVPSGSLDGVIKTKDGNLLISSWQARAVFQGKPEGSFKPVIADVTSPADIGYDAKRNRALVPIFQEDAIQIQELGTATAALRADAPEPETAAEKADAEGEEAKAEGAEEKKAEGAEEAKAADPSKAEKPAEEAASEKAKPEKAAAEPYAKKPTEKKEK